MIRIENLIHKYDFWESDNRKIKKTVLDGVSFDIPSGQFLAILGPNGCGKSTLARHLNALLLPDEGTVWIDGKNTADQQALWDIREAVGMVFQNPDNQIIGTTVEEDVAFGPENRCVSPEEIRARVEESLSAVGLLHKRKTSPSRLSGGQKQRVAIAGVKACQASCIVFDEPTAMLDPAARGKVLELIRYLNKEAGVTTILITHHMDEVVDADSVLLMDQGRIVRHGTPADIFSDLELLKAVKMEAPQITELADRIHKRGFPVRIPVLHEKELTDAVVSAFANAFPPELNAGHTGQAGQNRQRGCMEKSSEEAIFRVERIGYTYGTGTVNECKALKDISFEVHKGECIGLIGASGSGKTTLIRHLNGLLKADTGEIYFENQNIYDRKYNLTQLRRKVGLVFQYPENQLFGRTVLDDVCYGPMNLGMSRAEAEQSAKTCLELVGIDEKHYASSPFDLSGGEKRKAAIAGVLAMHPKVLVLDEPAAGLDPATKHKIFDMLNRLKTELQIAIILVSHHMEDVAEYTDKVLVLENGMLALSGTPEEVFLHTEYLRRIGIGIPQITDATEKMIQKGIPLPHPATMVKQAEEWLMSLFMKSKGAEVQ
ncbi:MAG: energy-coupling factor transporter ATPase [Lachnospiraceae bacterium]